jgi:colanic acid biosynthesis glycosyl transferase WcaI
MKILIYGINFSPELTGIGKYTGEMAVFLASRGHEVRVITANPYYPNWKVSDGYSSCRYTFEERDGVGVWRAPLWVPSRPVGINRLIHLASFAISSLPLLVRQIFWHPDVVWLVAPTLFCAPGGWLTARLARSRCWLHIQDFEVDASFEMGMLSGARLRAFIHGIESWLFRRFDRVSSISHRMIEHLYSKSLANKDVSCFPNWVNTDIICPIRIKADAGRTNQIAENTYRTELLIDSDTVVTLYSGNMGEKQGLEILSQAAVRTSGRKNLVWVFCGEGVGRANLELTCSGLSNVRFLPLQPVERFNDLLNLADIHLLPQRADVADLVMPSKLTGMLASGRAVVATALPGTQVATVCEKCGLVVPPGDVGAFVEAVLSLADDPAFRLNLGIEARAYAELHFGHELILSSFESELRLLVKS